MLTAILIGAALGLGMGYAVSKSVKPEVRQPRAWQSAARRNGGWRLGWKTFCGRCCIGGRTAMRKSLFLLVAMAVLLSVSAFAGELTVAGSTGVQVRQTGEYNDFEGYHRGMLGHLAYRFDDSRWSLVAQGIKIRDNRFDKNLTYAGAGVGYDIIQAEWFRLQAGATLGYLDKPGFVYNGPDEYREQGHACEDRLGKPYTGISGIPYVLGTVDLPGGFLVGVLGTVAPLGKSGWVFGVSPVVGWRFSF